MRGMQVARLHGPGDVRLSDESMPDSQPGKELVRVTAVGLCGSDLHWYASGEIGDARARQPLVIGHEFAGVIEGGPRHGQRVAVDPAISCRTCPTCRRGHPNLCPSVVFAGHAGQDGALREFLTWPSELLHPLPDGFGDLDGALLEPLGVAIHASDLGHVRVGRSVAVVGCGPIGLLLLQVARAGGAARMVAAEPLAHRREAASRLGADHVLDPADVAGAADDVDVAFEVAGTDDAVALAMTTVRPGGRVVLVGIPDHDRTSFPASLARRKGLTIAMARRMGDVYPRAIRLVEQRRVELSSLVTHTYPLARTAEALAAASERVGLKVAVTMDAAE